MAKWWGAVFLVAMIASCGVFDLSTHNQAQLVREPYTSKLDNTGREYFVYLPTGYHTNPDKQWPVLLFLHGNGERGDGTSELDFVLKHGPVYEAWIQKKALPFIIISPQLHMFDFAGPQGPDYIRNRTRQSIPERLEQGTPLRDAPFPTPDPIRRTPSTSEMASVSPLLPKGWDQVEQDLLGMLQNVKTKYRTDPSRTYLSGLSYGGFGTWYMASQHPEKFAAIAPVVGWGLPSLMAPIASHKVPVWAFAGGRDSAVDIQYFYAGFETLEQLGHTDVRLTVHEDMGHDAWTRVYSSDDLYHWLLRHQTK